MPRKPIGEKLEKVVSTKIGLADFTALEKYARIRYYRLSFAQGNHKRMGKWKTKRRGSRSISK